MTADPDPDGTDATEIVDRTVRVPRRGRATPDPADADETVVARRRRPDVSVESASGENGGRDAAGEPDADDTVRGSRHGRARIAAEPDAGDTALGSRADAPASAPSSGVAEDGASPDDRARILRAAYSPDASAVHAGYPARPPAPVAAERAPAATRALQPPADAAAVDRAIRARARRRLLAIAAAAVVVVLAAACLLAVLVIASAR